jgi:signal transduction histidine kinase
MDPIPTRRSQLADLLVALAFCAVGFYEVMVDPLAEDVVGGPTWLNLLAVALGTLPLALRRRAPFLVSLVMYGALAGRALAAEPLELYPTYLALLVATYTVASYAPLRDAALSAGFSALAISVAIANGTGTDSAPDPLASLVLFGTVWLVGRVVGVRNERAQRLHDERDRHAALAVTEERARIARELHDVVSHSLAAIVMQSGGARNVLEADPARARTSLEAIEETARRGLEEMRRMLGLLGDADAGLAPQPGLDRLQSLADAVGAGDLDVRVTIVGGRRPLAAAADAAAYRIVQEALTNVMKHSDARTATVTVRFEPGELVIDVADDGAPTGGDGTGRGLAGMAERAAHLGGTLEAGPRPGADGFRVLARWPL